LKRLPVPGEVIANDLSYIQAAIIEWRTDATDPRLSACSMNIRPGWSTVMAGGASTPDKLMFNLFRFSHPESDEVAGQQRTDTGDAAQGDARLLDQNSASSTINPSALLSIFAVTTTFV